METRAQCPFQKLNLAIAVKKHAQIDIKLFLSHPVFLTFSILFGTAAPRRRCLVIQKFIVMSEKGVCRHGIKTDRHITYSIFCIPNTNSEIYIRSHFLCLVKFVDISYVNHFGAIKVYKLRTSQIPELSISTLSLTRLAWHRQRCRTT